VPWSRHAIASQVVWPCRLRDTDTGHERSDPHCVRTDRPRGESGGREGIAASCSSQRCVVVGGRGRHRRGPNNARLNELATARGCARVMCLLHGEARKNDIPLGRRSALAKRFEEAVEANFDYPLPISDLCRVVGVSGRTLRSLCREQLGISPHRFLALRRLHLARRALLLSGPNSSTVTEIAMRHGLWELGRFAVAYKALFGESPSATLNRRPDTSRA
jgi:AraC-like DNA-binding protein